MDTLLELYDAREPLLNVSGAWRLKPRCVVCFYDALEDVRRERGKLADMLRQLGVNAQVRMEQLDGRDGQALTRWVEKHQEELGEWGIEICGGDEVMLFMAGCCHARFGCPVYARRPDHQYFSLPEGRLFGEISGGFTVEQRLSLYGGRLERYGRLTPKDLTLKLITLSGMLLGLQKAHPQLWTRQTRCLQGVVSRAPEDALEVLLTAEQCQKNGFSPRKGHVFRQMQRCGALTAVRVTEEGLLLTFPSALIRDCLCDYGVWLEIYVYGAMKQSGAFDDVRMSCVVRWEGDRAVNELDVVATAGLGLAVCSCKTCAPDMEALAELNVITRGFGSDYAVSLMACLPKGSDRMDGASARGEELDIRTVDVRQYEWDGLVAYFRRLGKRLQAMV